MNPLGPNGFLIKAGEHLPLVADGLRCYHKFKGQTEAEERARAFSLQRYLGKDGALVKVAELLPGSNLIASALLDLHGHHQEAQEALNLLKNWQQCGSPDGPLAKVAEMLPGVDVIAFALHVQSGNFAQALRSISKTRWTTITGDSLVINMVSETLHDWTITNLEVVNVDIDPVASFMYGGLLDVVTLLVEVNSQGQQRARRRRFRIPSASTGSPEKPFRRNPVYWAKDRLVGICKDQLSTLMQDTLPEMVPDMVASAVAAMNSLLPYYRASWWPYKVVLPKALREPPVDLEKVLAGCITRISLRHRTVVPVRAVLARDLPARPSAEGTALGALCCCAGIAHGGPWPLLGVGCALGCTSGLWQLSRWLKRRLVPWINSNNEQAWLGATKEPKQLYRRTSSASQGSCSSSRATARMPLAVVAELPGEDVERLASILGDYFCKQMPLTKLIGRSGMAWLNKRLSRFLASSVDGLTVLPVVLHAQVSEGLYKSLGETWWLPSFSFAVIFQCKLNDGLQVSTAQVVFTDDTIDQVLDVLQTEIRGIDFRGMDPRLAGFADPIHLHFQAMLSWPLTSSPRLDVRNLKVHLSLPG